ncbi:DUF5916 domain-containing protein [Spongiivirga citrea]|uniref:Hydrolase n=1 Tax=Spongiivirga citrea TaxID=1481457 RepID=A0A6M0CRC4_9FLAO|nr:DUF5916 domain-containing protein [Spongiivirga citrea]NER18067.1 hydrolase [Spongiivirga citrea]
MKIRISFVLLLALTTTFIFGQETETEASSENKEVPKKIYTTKAVSQESAPTIDGVLDDESWNAVEWGGDFIENQPDENTPPSEQTRFKILYDAKNLYIGVRAYDKAPDSIVKRLSRRDGFAGDWVEVNIDSYHDMRTAFSFTASVSGVKGDEFISNNGNNWDSSWNPIWYVATNVDEEGWTAEYRIPLSQLRFDKGDDQVWGIQFTRRLFRKEERSIWQRVPIDAAGWVSNFGELRGLKKLEPQKQREIQPYTVASAETFERVAGNPFLDGRDSKITFGLDGKIGITNDMTVDFTINPDFGQVEADPSAIALDGFQIFFREQRPFFVENANIFSFNLSQSQAGDTFGSDNLFYSRRIGRNPQGFPETDDGAYVDVPENTTILGAAKFSGKTKDGWSFGILESITSKEYAQIDTNGELSEQIVEPLTNYFVGRLQKDFNDGDSYVGGILTATNRDQLSSNVDFLHQQAYSGGLDFKHQWANQAWYMEGNVIGSHVRGNAEAITRTQRSITHLFQRVDADHVSVDETKTSLTGTGGNFKMGKAGDGNFVFESGATWRSPELEVNDLGFQRRADDIRHYAWGAYRILKPTKSFRRVQFNYNHWSAWDFQGNHNLLQFNANSWQNWQNNWFTNAGVTYTALAYNNFALRGGPRLRNSPRLNYWNNINSDGRKEVRFGFSNGGAMATDRSNSFFRVGFFVRYQPLDALTISVNPSYRINDDKLQWITNQDFGDEVRYLNGSIDQRTLSMSIRLNYNINPNMTLQYWGQPFISRGRYSDFKFITNPVASSFDDRFDQFDTNQISFDNEAYNIDENIDGITDYSFNNPDFSFVQWRSNLVFRWEYIPGSEVFLVWSQDISQSGDPADGLFGNLEDNVFGAKPKNIFLLKATYRLVL